MNLSNSTLFAMSVMQDACIIYWVKFMSIMETILPHKNVCGKQNIFNIDIIDAKSVKKT